MDIFHTIEEKVDAEDLLSRDPELLNVLSRSSIMVITVVRSDGRVETFDKGIKVKVQRADD